MHWVKLWVFQALGVGFAGRRRVLVAMRAFVAGGIDEPFCPRGRFTFRERVAMAFFAVLIRQPLAVFFLPPVFVLTGFFFGLRALGFLNF